MSQTETLLWTSSLILGSIGIVFGIIASINSAKANKRVKELVMDSFVAEGAAQLFFHDLKSIVANNKKVISLLKTKSDATYSTYGIIASKGRLNPVPRRMRMAISETEFAEIIEFYINEKQRQDDDFPGVIKNMELLVTQDKISAAARKRLVAYHNKVLKTSQEMITWYSKITEQTQTMSIGR